MDGNYSFYTMVEAERAQSMAKEIRPAIVVGIGYPTDDPYEVLKTRNEDLSTPISADVIGRMPPHEGLTG